MGTEIERKFLLKDDSWRGLGQGRHYRQGYLVTAQDRSVRVRTVDDQGFITVKGATRGATRLEFEYPVPLADAEAMLKLCVGPIIEKTRYRIPFEHKVWEVDEFEGDNRGLITAEVELHSEQEPVKIPSWIGKEVTDDPSYFNSNLVNHPYNTWKSH